MMNREYFSRKVPAYFDGTLTDSEKMELEAFVGSDTEFARYFKLKQTEYGQLKNSIPHFELSREGETQVENELKEVIDNLFFDESSSVLDKLSSWVKEKL